MDTILNEDILTIPRDSCAFVKIPTPAKNICEEVSDERSADTESEEIKENTFTAEGVSD